MAKRFFSPRDPIFKPCPWRYEGHREVFCYECHEELLHNPVLLPHAIKGFATLVQRRGFSEREKPHDRTLIAGRIQLLQEALDRGIAALLADGGG